MPQLQTDSSNQVASMTNATTSTLERQINELKDTIAKLAADGHTVKEATKQLDSMIENVRILKFGRKQS